MKPEVGIQLGIVQGRIQEVEDRGPSESLILAPRSKDEEWRPHSPSAVKLAPLKFSSLEPLRAPCLCMNGTLFVMLIIFSFFSFFLLFFFPFLFFFFSAPLVTRGATPGYAPVVAFFGYFWLNLQHVLIGISWCHSGIIKHFEIQGLKNFSIGIGLWSKVKCLTVV